MSIQRGAVLSEFVPVKVLGSALVGASGSFVLSLHNQRTE